MVNADIKTIIVSFLIFALFGISLISFGVNFGTENEADVLITDNNSAINTIYEGINDTIFDYKGVGLQEQANSSFSSFNSDSETSGILGTISDFFINTLLGVGKAIMGIGNTIFSVTFSPILSALGIPQPIASIIGIIISTIMLFTMVLLAWRLYRTGQ